VPLASRPPPFFPPSQAGLGGLPVSSPIFVLVFPLPSSPFAFPEKFPQKISTPQHESFSPTFFPDLVPTCVEENCLFFLDTTNAVFFACCWGRLGFFRKVYLSPPPLFLFPFPNNRFFRFALPFPFSLLPKKVVRNFFFSPPPFLP